MKHPLFLILLLSFAACQDFNDHYQKKIEFPDDTWTYNKLATYDFEVADTTLRYNMHLVIEHSDAFPFQNIYMRTKMTHPDSQVFERVISLDLADKSGYWHGACSGDFCKRSIQIQDKAFFPKPGMYKVQFEQYMRQDSLPKLRSLTFKVHKFQENK